MKKTVALFLAVLLFWGMTGCKPNNKNSSSVIKIAGSTSVAPLMKVLKDAYEANHQQITVEIQESGSSAGITAAIDGAADIGMSSRDLAEQEKSAGLKDTKMALDGIAVIVHPSNSIGALTTDQIRRIFNGEIKDWSEIGGKKGEIVVVSRESGSGTRGAFEELIGLQQEIVKNGEKLKKSLISSNALFENNTGAVKSDVFGNKNAIGYISLGTLDSSVKALKVNGVSCTADEVKKGAYSLARPFIICTKDGLSDISKKFIDYILSAEGQKIVAENHYISILS